VNGTCDYHLLKDIVGIECEREKERNNTIKIGISAINIMVDSFHMTEKLIAFGELAQNVVHCSSQ
jgi:hypothetical protein